MASLPPYVPSRDANLANWADNFATLIAAAPALYGLTAGDSVTISAAQAAFAAAYAVVTSPSTKTAEAVSAKNTAKILMLQTLRPYAQQIGLNAGVASSDKIALGINPRTSTPSPVSAPVTNPVLVFQSAGNLTLILRYRDSAAGVSVKAKPYGVMTCEVYAKVSGTPVVDAADLLHVASATKTPLTVVRGAEDAGKQLYIAARWKTRTGLVSPWSPIVNFTVPASV
jgi:hypothetical protein